MHSIQTISRRVLRLSAVIVFVVIILSSLPTAAMAEAAAAAAPTKPDYLANTSIMIGTGAYWILTFTLSLIGSLSQAFQIFIRYPLANAAVVEPTWKIIRDFCNMFFILVMIIMAFATIFDIGGYKLDSGVLTRLIIVAVLINFSLVISNIFIQGMDSINQIFVAGLGDIGARFQQVFNQQELLGGIGGNTSNRILSALGSAGCSLSSEIGGTFLQARCIQAISGSLNGVPSTTFTWAITMQIVFSAILSVIALFSLLTATAFVVIRIPFLWFLLIFSPLAVFSSILPATSEAWTRWKKEFLGWNLFLPVYLFVLYFGMYFIAQQNSIIASLNRTFPSSIFTEPIGGIGFSLQFLFFYVLGALILIGGTALAFSISRAGGGMATEYGSKWSQAFSNWAGDLTRVRPAYQGIGDAAVARYERIRQEGLLGGKAATQRFRAGIAQGFGATGALERQKTEQIKYFEDRYKKEGLDLDRLRAIAKTDSDPIKRLAAFRRLKDLKATGAEDLKEAYILYKSVGGSSAVDFTKDIDFKKDFDRGERRGWFEDKELADSVRQRVAKTMAEESELNSNWEKDGTLKPEKDDLAIAAALFGADGKSRREFLEKAAEKRPAEAYRLLMDEYKYKDPRTGKELIGEYKNPKTGAKYTPDDLERVIMRKEPDDILKMMSGFYDAKENKFPDVLNKDQQSLYDTLIKVTEKRGGTKKMLKKMYNNPKASAEQQGAIRKFAEKTGISVSELESKDDKGGDEGKVIYGPDGKVVSRVRADSESDSNNTIDLRNT